MPLDGLLNDTMLDLIYSQKQYATSTMNVFYDVLQIPGAGAILGHPNFSFEIGYSFVKKNVLAVYDKGIAILAGTGSSNEDKPYLSHLHVM